MNSKRRIIVTGLIAQHRLLGGVAWDYMNFVLGLSQLGHDVYYIEDSGEWPYNFDGGSSGDKWIAHDCKPNVEYLSKVMSHYGLADKWAYHFPIKSQWYGLSDKKREDLLCTADLLLNVSGTLEYPERYRSVQRLVYIDTDPAFTQIQIAQEKSELLQRVDAHDVHFSVGECVENVMSNLRHHWLPTKHPIVLSEWRTSIKPRDVFTTVMNWTSYKPLTYNGMCYGQKDIEFRRFFDLPNFTQPMVLEIALPKTHHTRWESQDDNLPTTAAALHKEHPSWTPYEMLSHIGWHVVDATRACSDFTSYRRYIQSSMAEWSVAKNGYVRGRTGWFSGRSACYLAASRPVVVQDTGFKSVLPIGAGVLTFDTLEEAADAILEVESNYTKHSIAAQSIATEYFDSNKVLTRIIDKVS